MGTRRGPTSLAALLLMGAGLVLGVATGCSDPAPLTAGNVDPAASAVDASGQSPPPPPPPPPPPSTAPSSPEPTGPPTDWLDDVAFYDFVGGVKLPGSPSAGPQRREDGLASGFSRTPMGAVLAGANILARIQGSIGAPVWVPTIQDQVVGPHQVYLLRVAQNSNRSETPAPGEMIVGSDLRFVGWKWLSYSDTRAVVQQLIAVTPPEPDDPPYLAIEVETRWSDGDWRMVAPEYGNWVAKAEQPTDDSGFEVYDAA